MIKFYLRKIMSFSLRIKELREERGLSQVKLARALNVGTGSVGMWESTNEIPPVKKLLVIADYFGVSLDYLVGRSDVRVPADGQDGFFTEYCALSPAKREILNSLVKSWREDK